MANEDMKRQHQQTAKAMPTKAVVGAEGKKQQANLAEQQSAEVQQRRRLTPSSMNNKSRKQQQQNHHMPNYQNIHNNNTGKQNTGMHNTGVHNTSMDRDSETGNEEENICRNIPLPPTPPPPSPQHMTPSSHKISPSPKDISPSPKDISPSSKDISPSPKHISPSLKDISPSLKDISPSLKDISPSLKDIPPSPKDIPKHIAPSPKDISPSSKDISPSSKDISPSPKDISPSPKDISPSPKDISPSPKDISPSPKDMPQNIAPSPKDISPSSKDISPSPKNISPSRKDIPKDISPSPKDISPSPKDIPKHMPPSPQHMPEHQHTQFNSRPGKQRPEQQQTTTTTAARSNNSNNSMDMKMNMNLNMNMEMNSKLDKLDKCDQDRDRDRKAGSDRQLQKTEQARELQKTESDRQLQKTDQVREQSPTSSTASSQDGGGGQADGGVDETAAPLPWRVMERCRCHFCTSCEEYDFTNEYVQFMMKQQQQQFEHSVWFAAHPANGAQAMASFCAARHAVALHMYQQQKDFYGFSPRPDMPQSVPVTLSANVNVNPIVNGNSGANPNVNGNSSGNTNVNGNSSGNSNGTANGSMNAQYQQQQQQSPAAIPNPYGSYMMVPYEVIEAYLHFLESMYPQLAHCSQQPPTPEPISPPSTPLHAELATLSLGDGQSCTIDASSRNCCERDERKDSRRSPVGDEQQQQASSVLDDILNDGSEGLQLESDQKHGTAQNTETTPPPDKQVVPENRPSVELEVEENREHSDEETHDTQNTTNAACAPPPASSFNRSGTFEVSKMDVLSEEMWDFHNTVTQSEALLNRKLHLRDMLYYCISPVFPMCGLYVVGSSLNGFGSNASDMDLCLMISQKDIDQRTDAVVVLGMIKSALGGVAWVREQQLIIAKVPILRIRFTEPFGEITVDLNANNSVAIRNTHLLCYYSSFDWRVRPLVSVVKEWAKRRDINDANRSTFTSYSLVLMVIHYLQCGANPAVLPSLQDLYPKRFNHRTDVRTLNVSIPLESPASGDWHFSEANTLGELLLGFLEYYAFKFDYVHDAISVRLASKIERSFVARQRSPYNNSIAQWNCICIEEPFTLSNTAHSVHSQMVFDAIREAFVDGFDELDTNRDLNAFLNAAPIRIGPHLTTPNGSGVQLNALSEAGYGLRRGSQDHALFLLDTSSDPSSTASSPRSTPSNIEEHGGVTSSESTDGDFIRHSTETSTTASDQESLGGSACAGRQRRRMLLTDQPQEMVNNASRPNAFRGRDHYMYNSKSPKWSGEDSVLEHEESQGRGRRRRNTTRRGVVQVNGGATGFKTTARARFN